MLLSLTSTSVPIKTDDFETLQLFSFKKTSLKLDPAVVWVLYETCADSGLWENGVLVLLFL